MIEQSPLNEAKRGVPQVTMRRAITDPNLLGNILVGDSWDIWRALLIASNGEPLEPAELELYRHVTGREASPTERVDEEYYIVGRRGGKDSATAVKCAYHAALVDYSAVLVPGETGVVLCAGLDRDQAKVQRDRIEAAFEQSPLLRKLIKNTTEETIELSNGISIRVRSANYRRLRSQTYVAAVCSELAFFYDDESANPDVEVLNSIRPGLITTRGPLVCISSPHARRGALWEAYDRHYGEKGDPRVLVAKGPSWEFNRTLPKPYIDAAYERDPAKSAAEYGAEFRTDVESFVSIEAVRACVMPGIREAQPDRQWRYFAFTDPSGGSQDSFTLAIAHKAGNTAILDLVREVKPKFSPEQVTEEFCDTLKRYRITRVCGDRYAGEWPREQFRKHGITYELSDKSASEIFVNTLPLINSRSVDLLDDNRLVSQIAGLERQVRSGASDKIEHRPGYHDDVAVAACGALLRAWEKHGNKRENYFGTSPRITTANLGYASFKEKYRGSNWQTPRDTSRPPTRDGT